MDDDETGDKQNCQLQKNKKHLVNSKDVKIYIWINMAYLRFLLDFRRAFLRFQRLLR